MTSPMPEDPDHALMHYMLDLAVAEQTGQAAPVPILLGPFTAINVAVALQLAMRHPEIGDAVRPFLQGVVDHIAAAFTGTPGAEIIERGAWT